MTYPKCTANAAYIDNLNLSTVTPTKKTVMNLMHIAEHNNFI